MKQKSPINERVSSGLASLNAARFQVLLLRLDPDRNQAGERYEELRRKLIKFFQWNSCFPAEELVDETLDRVAGKLEVEEIRDLPAFAWGVAKNVRQEEQKRSSRMVRISDLPQGDDSLPHKQCPEDLIHDKISQEQRGKCFRRCFHTLSETDRGLFLKYHRQGSGAAAYRQHLAGDCGLTIAALRVRINRMRDKLEKCVRKCTQGPGTAKQ